MKEYLSKPEINFFMSVLIPLIALAVSWGVITTRVNHVEALALGIQEQYNQQVKVNEDIKVSLARIETDILYIRKSLDEHIN